jgi:isopentenyl phosphate kinase
VLNYYNHLTGGKVGHNAVARHEADLGVQPHRSIGAITSTEEFVAKHAGMICNIMKPNKIRRKRKSSPQRGSSYFWGVFSRLLSNNFVPVMHIDEKLHN